MFYIPIRKKGKTMDQYVGWSDNGGWHPVYTMSTAYRFIREEDAMKVRDLFRSDGWTADVQRLIADPWKQMG